MIGSPVRHHDAGRFGHALVRRSARVDVFDRAVRDAAPHPVRARGEADGKMRPQIRLGEDGQGGVALGRRPVRTRISGPPRRVGGGFAQRAVERPRAPAQVRFREHGFDREVRKRFLHAPPPPHTYAMLRRAGQRRTPGRGFRLELARAAF